MHWQLFLSLLAAREGKKEEQDIAQLAETSSIVFEILGSMTMREAAMMIAKYPRPKKKRRAK